MTGRGRRPGPWRACAPAAWPARAGCRRPPLPARPRRTPARTPRARLPRPAVTRDRSRRTPAPGCGWPGCPDATLRGRRVGPRSALLRPTRLSPSPPPDAAGLERSISISSVGPGRPGGAGSLGVTDGDDRRPDRDGRALLDEDRGDRAGVGRRQLDQGLGGLDLHDDVVDRDHVADLDLPGHDLGLREALADVGKQVLGHVRTPSIGRRRRARGPGRGGSPPRSARRGRGCRTRRPAAPAPRGSRSTAP